MRQTVSILGCGWLGKPLAISLLDDGFLVKGSTTTVAKLAALETHDIEAYLIDVEEFEEYDAFLASDILIIAITSKNSDAFESLIAQLEQSSVQKVIFISSTSVYPNTNAVVTEENATLQNSLTEIENLFKNNTFFDTTILRFGGLFGKGRSPGNWFMHKKIPQPNGFVNMIHQEDCIAIIHEVIAQNCWNITLNACSNHHPTRKEFYTQAKLNLKYDVPAFEENEVLSYKIISSAKIQSVLEYQFIHENLLAI